MESKCAPALTLKLAQIAAQDDAAGSAALKTDSRQTIERDAIPAAFCELPRETL
jgi:hypothetical protein